jgi:hypothetical protein
MKGKLVIRRTRRQALTLCKKCWQKIKETKSIGVNEKYKAFESLRTQTDPNACSGCFACEYQDTHRLNTCDDCILSNIWPKGCTCTIDDSPFSIWRYAYGWTPEVEEAVDKIIAGCDEALELLNKKGKRS